MNMEYIKQFQTHNQYEAYAEGENFVTPNVSYCVDNDELHFTGKPTEETRLIAYFYIDRSGTYPIMGYDSDDLGQEGEPLPYLTDYFTEIEVDGVVLDEVTGEYQFDTTGYHTVKYTLADPTIIDDFAFYNCDTMVYVKMPTGIITIGDSAFQETFLRNITIPETVTTIGAYAFRPKVLAVTLYEERFETYEGKANLVIPDSVTSIGTGAFYGYSHKLLIVYIGENVQNIGENAFSMGYKPNDREIQNEGGEKYAWDKIFYFFGKTPPTVDTTLINYHPAAILVPPTSVIAYKEATGFTNYTEVIYDYNKELDLSELSESGYQNTTATPINNPWDDGTQR